MRRFDGGVERERERRARGTGFLTENTRNEGENVIEKERDTVFVLTPFSTSDEQCHDGVNVIILFTGVSFLRV